MPITQQDFDKIEKYFLAYLKRVLDDISNSISILRKNKPELVKSELCLAFVCADTFSRFHRIILGIREEDLDKKIEGRFKTWFSEFVFTSKNEVFVKHKAEINCDTNTVWELRNSLIHFYGLPRPDEQSGVPVTLSGGNADLMRQREQRFREISGKQIKLVHPYFLIEAIKAGLLVQLLSMTEMIKQSPSAYANGVLRAHKIIGAEGTVYVSNEHPISKLW